MITLKHIPAHPVLKLFIQYYRLLEFDTGGLELIRPWHATTDAHICIFLNDKPLCLKNEATGYYVQGDHQIGLLGIATKFNGLMKFKGKYRCFIIRFTPNGIHKLMNIPGNEIINRIVDADKLFGAETNELPEKLYHADTIEKMAAITDDTMLRFYRKIKHPHLTDGITSVAIRLFTSGSFYNVKECAGIASMSIRNFERKFKEQVGIPPKLYTRLIKFEDALSHKTKDSSKSWTSIANECNYYDQAHMLKDFHDFAGLGPKDLIAEIPPLKVESIFIARSNYSQ